MKKIFIPEVEIEIGDNLYLRITELSFSPAIPGYISSRPEDCYEPVPACASWKDENCHLTKKSKKIKGPIFGEGGKMEFENVTLDFMCEPALSEEYYDQIIEAIEQGAEWAI